MSKRALPKLPIVAGTAPRTEWDIPKSVLARWNAGVQARQSENTIGIYDPIGESWDGSGVTAKRVAAQLRDIGDNQVTVDINSPGGNVFEGFAIYNLLRDHPRKVNVRVIGIAASAASVVAMAGDNIQIARAGFLMMHNTWTVAIGNRHDLRALADMMEPFDDALAEIYALRSGGDKAAIADMLNQELWLNGSQAVDEGFADELLPADQVEEKDTNTATSAAAMRRVDALLAKQGMPRSERRALLRTLGSTPGAAPEPTPSAGNVVSPEVAAFAASSSSWVKSIHSER